MKELTATTATGEVSSQEVSGPYEQVRDRGMRSIRMWVTDVRAPEFASEAHRQSAAVAASEHAVDDQAFVDALSFDAG